WDKAMEGEDFAKRFTAAMDCRGVYLAQAAAKQIDLSRHRHLLDIAGGSGIYACSFAAHHPHLRATVFEKPPVDQIARRMVESRGFSKRVSVASGDMFKDAFPQDCDLHLFSNVLHDWYEALVQMLLSQLAEAIP